jgi:SAM-dependent methyltransferase
VQVTGSNDRGVVSMTDREGWQALEGVYRRHHSDRRPSGFIFCEPERVPLFASGVGGPGLRVLDLGCRDGALSVAYLTGNEVVGVDVDRAALSAAERRGIRTVWADLDEPLPFEDATFDAVVVGEVLEHLRFPELAILEARRVLRPGGVLVGSVPNNYRLKSRLRFLFGRPPERDPTILRLFGTNDVARLLDGWTDVEIVCISGRLVRLHPRWFANDIAFRARSARTSSTPSRVGAPASRAARALGTKAAGVALLLMLFVLAVLPELLGDHPYNVFGH